LDSTIRISKDIVHVNAFVSLAAVTLQVEFAEFLLLIRNNKLMFKLALFPL